VDEYRIAIAKYIVAVVEYLIADVKYIAAVVEYFIADCFARTLVC